MYHTIIANKEIAIPLYYQAESSLTSKDPTHSDLALAADFLSSVEVYQNSAAYTSKQITFVLAAFANAPDSGAASAAY